MGDTTNKMKKMRPCKSVFRFAISLALFTVLCGICEAESIGDKYYYYHVDGEEISADTQVRLKRQASTLTTTIPSTTVTSPIPGLASTLSSTTESTYTPGGSRGMLPHDLLDVLEKVDIPDNKINDTVTKEAKADGENITTDNKKYYKYSFVPYESTWVDLDFLNSSGVAEVQEHKMLSKSYRRAATIRLHFKFPFYGHMVENITIATGGFLYVGDYVHSWLAATQYIAPLMANFDLSQDENAKIRYADNGTTLIVEWKNVYLQTRDKLDKTILEGPFTFQVILHDNGDIAFAYKELPIKITSIVHEEHPIKVGLSDAYIIDRTIFFVRRKTIYEYHRVNMKDHDISNSTAIYLKALPTCNIHDTCGRCLKAVDEENNSLGCMWCPKISLCSDGMDRNRQQWLLSSCDSKKNHISAENFASCHAALNTQTSSNTFNSGIIDPNFDDESSDTSDDSEEESQQQLSYKTKKGEYHHVGIATSIIIVTLVVAVVGWLGYAYFFPHTWSGQLLIKYRPSRWHWRRGEPRYTAASIHM